MDAAQMLTAREIARQCEQLARTDATRENRGTSAERVSGRHLRSADPVTEPIEKITEPVRADWVREQPAHFAQERETQGLSEREWQILAFERQWWKRAGAKEKAIRELFDMPASRYYQQLNALVNRPAALRADPMLIKRLRKVRASRQRVRDARQPGIELH